MNYSPALLQQLAAAHVLGALRGRARSRFERLCLTLPAAQAARQQWENRLLPLSLAIAPQRVAALGWSAIRLRIQEADHGVARTAPRPGGLRWVAAASIVALGLLFGEILLHNQPDWRPVATLSPPNGRPQWRVERSADFSRLRVETFGEAVAPNGGNYELWVVPAAGGNPVSLGIIPARGEQARLLDARQQALLMTAMNIAVSLEPGGGSRNGLPTQVLFAAPVSGAG